MIDRIKIASFQNHGELAIAQSKLESLGITTWVEDELTIQSYNFLSNAIGGIKLFVAREDYDEAYAILLECGFIDERIQTQSKLERIFSDPKKYGIIKKITVAFFTLLGGICIALFVMMFVNRPTLSERLINNYWCVDYVFYQDLYYYPETYSEEFRIVFYCAEEIDFKSKNNVLFPGFQSLPVNGKWRIENDSIIVDSVEGLKFFYEKKFLVEFDKNQLILKSDSVDIYCYKSFR